MRQNQKRGKGLEGRVKHGCMVCAFMALMSSKVEAFWATGQTRGHV